jgi:hypothetical protein
VKKGDVVKFLLHKETAKEVYGICISIEDDVFYIYCENCLYSFMIEDIKSFKGIKLNEKNFRHVLSYD